MDEKSQHVLNFATDSINNLIKISGAALDYSPASIELTEEILISTNKDPSVPQSTKNNMVMIFAIYVGSILIKEFSNLKFNLLFNEKGFVEEVQLKDEKGTTLNLASWVLKFLEDSEGDRLVSKYIATSMFLKGELQIPPKDK